MTPSSHSVHARAHSRHSAFGFFTSYCVFVQQKNNLGESAAARSVLTEQHLGEKFHLSACCSIFMRMSPVGFHIPSIRYISNANYNNNSNIVTF